MANVRIISITANKERSVNKLEASGPYKTEPKDVRIPQLVLDFQPHNKDLRDVNRERGQRKHKQGWWTDFPRWIPQRRSTLYTENLVSVLCTPTRSFRVTLTCDGLEVPYTDLRIVQEKVFLSDSNCLLQRGYAHTSGYCTVVKPSERRVKVDVISHVGPRSLELARLRGGLP